MTAYPTIQLDDQTILAMLVDSIAQPTTAALLAEVDDPKVSEAVSEAADLLTDAKNLLVRCMDNIEATRRAAE